MPKIKTHRAAAILEKKTPKRKRNLRKATLASAGDRRNLVKLLPYA